MLLTLWLLLLRGDGTEIAVEAPLGGDTDEVGEESSDPGDSSERVDSPETEEAAPATECELAADAPSTLRLTSPDIQAEMPKRFDLAYVRQKSFPTPSFEWGGVPPATTELVIVVLTLVERGVEASMEETPDFLAGGLPNSQAVWVVGGIDPGTHALAATNATSPLPDRAVAHDHGAASVQIGDQMSESLFVGPSGFGETYLFAIFALCEGEGGIESYNAAWIAGRAIDVGWFTAATYVEGS